MKTILVVDDEENIRLLFTEELKSEGYHVIAAASGEEALELIKKEDVDAITLDLKLARTGMSGAEFLHKVKEIKREIPVIIVSAYGIFKQDFALWASDSYITKSSDLSELKKELERILGKK